MATRTSLTSSEVERLVAAHPGLPIDYLTYVRDVGWGESPSGHMIYSGPIHPSEVYTNLHDDQHIVLIGDDMQGYCLAYSFAIKRYGELSDTGTWTSFRVDFNLAKYLAGEGV